VNVRLVDVRPRPAYADGHIPGAKSIPWARAINPDDGSFKDAAELTELYVKTNIDATHPEWVSIRIASSDRIQSFKFHPGDPPAALVTADMDWSNFSVKRLESLHVMGDGTRKTMATLKYEPADKAVYVTIPAMERMTPEKTDIKALPWHVYNFDLASLNFAFRHLKDKNGRFEYLVSPKNDVPSIPVSALKFEPGTSVKHFDLEIPQYSQRMTHLTGSLWWLLQNALFDPVLPVWAEEHRQEIEEAVGRSMRSLERVGGRLRT
jgi:rhodanese-related sulfurtransferase